jgi:hypothetical protein
VRFASPSIIAIVGSRSGKWARNIARVGYTRYIKIYKPRGKFEDIVADAQTLLK